MAAAPVRELTILREGRRRGLAERLRSYARLSGPGWLQSAITLGGGSLAGSLYLGILGGVRLLWIQPLAMLVGIVMLNVAGRVALESGQRPFALANRHLTPVFGWLWILAVLAANMVWALPQYALAEGVVRHNLLTGIFADGAPLGGAAGKAVIVTAILAACTAVTWSYGAGSKGIRLYETVLKGFVALIVACFAAVAVRLWMTADALSPAAVLNGFVPSWSSLVEPAAAFSRELAGLPFDLSDYWSDLIVGKQRDILIAAAATAVGINMTFLYPSSLLARGWTAEFRGLATFDLVFGMFVPFVLATAFVVMAAAAAFHGVPEPGLVSPGGSAPPPPAVRRGYDRLLEARVFYSPAPVRPAERRVAAMLADRDAGSLADALAPVTGGVFAHLIFGLGVLGMTLSTISVLMLISGLVVCEVLERPPSGWTFRLGSLAASTGVLGPFLWKQAAFYLAIPTSVFGMCLLPVAYLVFALLFNSPRVMGRAMPHGGVRVAWNSALFAGLLVTGLASAASIRSRTGWPGLALFGGLLAAGLLHARWRRGGPAPRSGGKRRC